VVKSRATIEGAGVLAFEELERRTLIEDRPTVNLEDRP
jgi:hypothetical protein